jgi:PAS domain S-box-containing protein
VQLAGPLYWGYKGVAFFQRMPSNGPSNVRCPTGARPIAQVTDNRPPVPLSVWRYLAQIAIVTGAQFAAGKLGDLFGTINNGGIGPVWPAAGIALGAVLLCGYSVWPGVAAGAFLLGFFGPLPLAAAIVYATGTTLAALLAALLLRRIAKFENSLSRLRDALGLIVLGAFSGSVVSASIGVPTLYTAHIRGWSGFGSAWLIYWLGDSIGVLVVTPLVLTLPPLFRIRDRHRPIELATLLLLLIATCFIVFDMLPIWLDVLTFAVLSFVMWASIRFDPSVTALSIFLLATIATAETALGRGPFAAYTQLTNVVLLDVLLGVVSITGLTLAAVVAEREQSLRRQAAMEARLRLATIVESSDDAIISKNLDGVMTSWNAAAQQIFGFTEAEAVGRPITILTPPELQDEEKKILQRLRAGERIEHLETTRVAKSGRKVDVSLTISPIRDAAARVVGASIISRDITEQKREHEALKKSEERFSKAFRQSPMALTLTTAKDHRYLDVNETFERITGWHREEVMGRTPFDIGIWVDPSQRVDFVKRTLAEGSVRDWEVHYRCKDGAQRVGLGAAELIEIGNEPCILSVIADVTDRKRAEEALSGMSQKLIQAQEQERTRIARDLHDDVAQRLALLAIELAQVQQHLPDSVSELRAHVGTIRNRAVQIATDVQTISHELHSSKLEYLGIVAAMKGFCKEFGERQKVEIGFRSRDLPTQLSPEISLCLFRVLQEALHNAAKHSGVQHFEVQLWGTSDEILLTVSDLGEGFDTETGMKGSGLGLTSMQERLRLVNGKLSIDSQPKRGTTIHARVPFRSSINSARAG